MTPSSSRSFESFTIGVGMHCRWHNTWCSVVIEPHCQIQL